MIGIDEAAEQRHWRPLWKVVLASAMCFLAGYPPTWVVIAVVLLAYSAFRSDGLRLLIGTAVALTVSLAISMVQILPMLAMTSLKATEVRYGGGIQDPRFYLSYLIPNLYDFGIKTPVGSFPGQEYLYWGAAGTLGVCLGLFCKTSRPALAALLTGLLFLVNPFDVVRFVLLKWELGPQIVRDWYFLAAIPITVAPMVAIGLGQFLKRPTRTLGSIWAVGWSVLLAAWSARQLWMWLKQSHAAGWWSGADALVSLVLFAGGLFLLRTQTGTARAVLTLFLFGALMADFKAYGTSKRMSATDGTPDWSTGTIPEMDAASFGVLRANSRYRVAIDATGPMPQCIRHVGLSTPQGFDPFFSTQYKTLMESVAKMGTNWDPKIDPANEVTLQLLGIRYYISAEQGSHFKTLSSHPRFRALPSNRFYRVFEYLGAKAPYGWTEGPGDVEIVRWSPEHREFKVQAGAARGFYLAEQWAPGWTAKVDGATIPTTRWRTAFSQVTVPAGEHTLTFDFRTPGQLIGAAGSLLTVLLLLAVLFLTSALKLPIKH